MKLTYFIFLLEPSLNFNSWLENIWSTNFCQAQPSFSLMILSLAKNHIQWAHCYYTTVIGQDFLATWYFKQIYWQLESILIKSQQVRIRLTKKSIIFSKVKIMWKGKWRINEKKLSGIRIAKFLWNWCPNSNSVWADQKNDDWPISLKLFFRLKKPQLAFQLGLSVGSEDQEK